MNSVLHVPDSVVIGDVNVLNLQATHPFAQDLEFHLRSPANTDVVLFGRQVRRQRQLQSEPRRQRRADVGESQRL